MERGGHGGEGCRSMQKPCFEACALQMRKLRHSDQASGPGRCWAAWHQSLLAQCARRERCLPFSSAHWGPVRPQWRCSWKLMGHVEGSSSAHAGGAAGRHRQVPPALYIGHASLRCHLQQTGEVTFPVQMESPGQDRGLEPSSAATKAQGHRLEGGGQAVPAVRGTHFRGSLPRVGIAWPSAWEALGWG